MQHKENVASVSFSADGARLMTAAGHTVQRWDSKTGAAVGKPFIADSEIHHASFDALGERIVAVAFDSIYQWRVLTGEQIREKIVSDKVEINDGYIGAYYTGDGRHIIALRNWTAELRDAVTGSSVGDPIQLKHGGSRLLFSGDGSRIVFASDDDFWLLDGRTGAVLGKVFEGSDAHFTFDSKFVLFASNDHIHFVDAITGQRASDSFEGISRIEIDTLDSSRKLSDLTTHNQLVTYSGGSVEVWDLPTGAQLRQEIRLNFRDRRVHKVLMSPDGNKLLVLDEEGWRVWNINGRLPPVMQRASAATLASFAYLDSEDLGSLFLDRKTQVSEFESLLGVPQKGVDREKVTRCLSRDSTEYQVSHSLYISEECNRAINSGAPDQKLLYQYGRQLMLLGKNELARDAFTRAANNGEPMGYIGLVLLALKNKNSTPFDQTLELTNQAADHGAATIANFLLGHLYWSSNKQPNDRQRALALWELSATAGNPYSAAHLAELEERDDIPEVPQDYPKALLHWAKAAQLFDEANVAGSDDATYARARKASLARLLIHQGKFGILEETWKGLRDAQPTFLSKISSFGQGAK
jgi:hypothetical protein